MQNFLSTPAGSRFRKILSLSLFFSHGLISVGFILLGLTLSSISIRAETVALMSSNDDVNGPSTSMPTPEEIRAASLEMIAACEDGNSATAEQALEGGADPCF